jgi:signal transduction histidine kinase
VKGEDIMNGFGRLAVVETRLFLRERAAAVAVFGLPVALVIGFGLIPGFGDPQKGLSGQGMIAELAEANHRLEEMIAENTGLQAQLLTQAREAGAGDERQRMAREIHDTLAQGLTGIITQLEAVQQTASEAERERRIGNAKRLARDSLAEARRSVQALRPQALEGTRLPEALAGEVARWSATSGISGAAETTGDARALHPEVEVTLLRVAQEALANVAKHASASRAGVTLSYMGDVVSLDVRDDGVGFTRPVPANGAPANGAPATGGPAGGGFGLISMRQRVQRLAGQLEIESEPGSGTAVSASLPAIPVGESR